MMVHVRTAIHAIWPTVGAVFFVVGRMCTRARRHQRLFACMRYLRAR